MTARDRRWRPLSERHVAVLLRCADAADVPAQARAARALAGRIASFVAEGRGRFGADDVRVLTAVGEELVRRGRATLAEPDPSPADAADATARIRLGAEVLGVRDRLQQFAPVHLAHS